MQNTYVHTVPGAQPSGHLQTGHWDASFPVWIPPIIFSYQYQNSEKSN